MDRLSGTVMALYLEVSSADMGENSETEDESDDAVVRQSCCKESRLVKCETTPANPGFEAERR